MTPRSLRLRFEAKWNRCQACPLHKTAKRHVNYRGNIPAQVMFLGEAPGKVEDRLGLPFVGPSGDVLEDTIRSLELTSYVITNTVCCIPWEIPGESTREPSDEEVAACFQHVAELHDLCRPELKLIVTLGEVAKRHLAKFLDKLKITSPQEILHLRHPAYVLRRGGRGSYEHKQFTYTLQKALRDLGIEHKTVYDEVSYGQEETSQEV